jgi:MFS family permease
LIALMTFLLVPAPATTLSERRAERQGTTTATLRRTPLIVLGIGLGLGVFSATGVAAFLVIDAVRIGIGRGNAGLTVALASAAAVIGRVVTGYLADRRGGRHFPVVATMMTIGAFGYFALAIGALTRLHWLYVSGAVFALGIGWGWNGLFNFATIRTHQHAPARATGVTQVGGRLGGMLGPIVLGVIATNLSFPAAWLVAGLSTGCGAVAVMLGRRLLLKPLPESNEALQSSHPEDESRPK